MQTHLDSVCFRDQIMLLKILKFILDLFFYIFRLF
jgi:hypothetical protein